MISYVLLQQFSNSIPILQLRYYEEGKKVPLLWARTDIHLTGNSYATLLNFHSDHSPLNMRQHFPTRAESPPLTRWHASEAAQDTVGSLGC